MERKGQKPRFRHELKYLINPGDKELIAERLRVVLTPDPHAVDGEYHIRSLYFDDYRDSAYYDKMGGFSGRRKYRIRFYNCDDRVIKLECKRKEGRYIYKRSAPLTREELDRIIRHDFNFLLARDEELCREFYVQCVSSFMRPRVIVDYEREPYILDAGDVRVTFDKCVRASAPMPDLFSRRLPSHWVLEPGKLVMEVKYTEFLPGLVKRVLPPRAAEMSAVSKYTLCYEKLRYLHGRTVY